MMIHSEDGGKSEEILISSHNSLVSQVHIEVVDTKRHLSVQGIFKSSTNRPTGFYFVCLAGE